jgi:hypothetical protein
VNVCFSQVARTHRDSKHPEIVTIVPIKPMKFSACEKDTNYVTIFADSTDHGYEFGLSILFAKCVTEKFVGLTIGFVDSTRLDLDYTHLYESVNYATHLLTEKELAQLRNVAFNLIIFRMAEHYTACSSIRTKDFFMNFLRPYRNGY